MWIKTWPRRHISDHVCVTVLQTSFNSQNQSGLYILHKSKDREKWNKSEPKLNGDLFDGPIVPPKSIEIQAQISNFQPDSFYLDVLVSVSLTQLVGGVEAGVGYGETRYSME